MIEVGLRDMGRRLVEQGGHVSPEQAAEGQRLAREAGDDEALALWSRLRVRALRRARDPHLIEVKS